MPFTIPNAAVAEDVTQAQPDQFDFNGMIAAAFAGTGIVTGCAVTAQGTPNMTVAVAAGTIAIGAVTVAVTAGNVTIAAADATNPRFDLICVNNLGTLSAVAGTPAAAPVFPDPAGKAVLAAVRVPNAATAINSAKIVDKRLVAVIPTVIGAGSITSSMIQDGAIVNVDIAAAAAIAISKLAGFPNLVTQNLNGDGTWSIPILGPLNQQTGNYTLAITDSNKIVEMNVAAANTVTIPNDSVVNLPIGTTVDIAQIGAGQTSIAAAGGVTARAYNNNLRLAGQYAMASLVKRAANDWYVAGNLVP